MSVPAAESNNDQQTTTPTQETPLAKVIPLPLFDPFAEADKPR